MSQPDLPYPILRSFKAEGDTITVKSLKLWISDYHLEPAQTAANDNSPDVMPVEWETNVYEYSGDDLVAALEEDEKLAKDPTFEKRLPPYSAEMHGERHHRHVRRASKPMPAHEVDAEAETIRYLDAKKMRKWLGKRADVLDMAVSPFVTFADIGERILCAPRRAAVTEGKREVIYAAAKFCERAA